jgi:arabinofuranosyltransferase
LRKLPSPKIQSLGFIFILSAVVAFRSWLTDDALITFRVVYNMDHGLGLGWNLDERVQAFTSPLWTLVLAAFALLTRELHITCHLLQVALVAATAAILSSKLCRTLLDRLLGASLLVLSKAFVDYSSSGLENTLGLALLALYLASYFRKELTPRTLRYEALLTSLALVNRLDTVFLYAPMFLVRLAPLWTVRRPAPSTVGGRRALVLSYLSALGTGALPLVLWELFSFFYFGFFIPNSALAKLSSGVPLTTMVGKGLIYLSDSLNLDPITLVAVSFGVLVAVRSKRRRSIGAAMGAIAYLAYVISVGGDFMSGRFLTHPFLLAVALLVRASLRPRVLSLIEGATLAMAITMGIPSLTDAWASSTLQKNFDAVFNLAPRERPRTSLVHCLRANYIASDPRAQEARLLAGKPYSFQGAIGIGYYVTPRHHIFDPFGLADPLFARMPVDREKHPKVRVGHYPREIPSGYVGVLTRGPAAIQDPDLRRYYAPLWFIVRGPLWSAKRLRTALEFNLGYFDHHLERFLKNTLSQPPGQD